MYKIQPIRVAYQKPVNFKFCAPFKINIQKRERLFNFDKPVLNLSELYPKKSEISKKLKVSTLDIRIKQAGLKISHSIKFPVLYYISFYKTRNTPERNLYIVFVF